MRKVWSQLGKIFNIVRDGEIYTKIYPEVHLKLRSRKPIHRDVLSYPQYILFIDKCYVSTNNAHGNFGKMFASTSRNTSGVIKDYPELLWGKEYMQQAWNVVAQDPDMHNYYIILNIIYWLHIIYILPVWYYHWKTVFNLNNQKSFIDLWRL